MKAYGGVNVQIHIFLTSALVRYEWSASRPGSFTPEERTPGTHWTGGWLNPRAGPDSLKRKFLTLPGLELRPLVVQLVACRYTDCAIPAPIEVFITYLHSFWRGKLPCQLTSGEGEQEQPMVQRLAPRGARGERLL
jgi:hypothetical protein